MHSIRTNIHEVRRLIDAAAIEAGRAPGEIRLVAATKSRSVAELEAAIEAGVCDFGESYVQEALPKIAALHGRNVTWHFIGAVQSNKTRDIANHFHWVHTVDRERIAHRLSEQRMPSGPPLDVLLQVNIDDEPQKAGVAPARVRELASIVMRLPRLRVRGLMAIPRPRDSVCEQRDPFDSLARLFHTVGREIASDWDSLSMGMSGDFPAAIAAGSTMVRIGTAIFGEREPAR